MKTLILMRHAKSDWSQPGLTDHERPLNRRGRRAARLMGGYLNDSSRAVDLILASTAVRVQQTLELLRETWLYMQAEIVTDRRLYLANSETIWNLMTENASERDSVMVLGHNPGIGELCSSLSNQFCPFPTAAVSIFTDDLCLTEPIVSKGRWRMVDFRRPRDLE